MSDIQKEIERLRGEQSAAENQLSSLEQLLAIYPDLRTFVGRWEKKVYCSKQANGSVTNCDIRHNCGCCSDSPLEVWPYLETEHGKVYSDPPRFMVGEKDYSYYDRPYDGWAKQMGDAGISTEAIAVVRAYFKKQRDERRAELQEELERLGECPECEGDEYLQPCEVCGAGQ